jgi:hypothetical protein
MCMRARSPVSFQTMHIDPLEKRVETVGRVQPHAKAKIVDREGKVVPVGVPGEICVAGYLLQKGCVLLSSHSGLKVNTALDIGKMRSEQVKL